MSVPQTIPPTVNPRPRQLAGGRHDCTQPQRTRRKQPRRRQQSLLRRSLKRRGQEMGSRHQHRPTTNRQQRSFERHDLAHHSTRWLDAELHAKPQCKQQTLATTATLDPDMTHEQTTCTTETHDQDGGGTEKDDDSLLIRFQIIDS